MTIGRAPYVYVGLAGETAPGRPVQSGLYRMAAGDDRWQLQDEIHGRGEELSGQPEHVEVARWVVLELSVHIEVSRPDVIEPDSPLLEQPEVAVKAGVRDDRESQHQREREHGYQSGAGVEPPCEPLDEAAAGRRGRVSIRNHGPLGAVLGHLVWIGPDGPADTGPTLAASRCGAQKGLGRAHLFAGSTGLQRRRGHQGARRSADRRDGSSGRRRRGNPRRRRQ